MGKVTAAKAFDQSTRLPELSQDELSLLLSLGERLISELDIDNVLSLIAQTACEVVSAETMAVPLIDFDHKTFTYAAANGLHAEMVVGQTFPLGEGACGWVLKHERPLLFGEGGSYDLNTDAKWEPGMASSLLAPLISRGRIIGGLSAMGKKGGGAYNPRDLAVLIMFANQASIAIDNARLFHALREEEARLRLVLDSASEGIYGIDNNGICSFANSACVRMLGYPDEAALIGKQMHEVIHHSDADGRHQPLERCKINKATNTGKELHFDEEVLWREDSSHFPVELWSHPIYRDGRVEGSVVTFVDISERKHSEERIRQLAYFDPLTGLPNRRLLMDRLHQAIRSGHRNGEYVALLMLDLDHFKDLNDTQGHDAGDQLLTEVARRLTDSVRQEDTVSRVGGDEYVVVSERLGTDESAAAMQAETIAEKIRQALGEPYVLAGNEQTFHSSASVGVTLFRGQDVAVDVLLKQADVALYQAKSAGRDTIRFFNPDMQRTIELRSAMEHALRNSLLRKDELKLYYQPQVDRAGQLIGAEALLRWFPAHAEPVPPSKFIGLAEDTGLILPLGAWVLEQACMQLKHWSKDSAKSALTISVNVSAQQFHQPDFVEQVWDQIKRTRIDPAKLKIELTESVVLDRVEEVAKRMRQLKALGVTFSLDDFGTGFSSLSYLKRLPLDQIKIDQSFIQDITHDPNDAAIVRAILVMSRSLGLEVIAEGVETAEQRQFLHENGCPAYQGYLFGRPMPIEKWNKKENLPNKAK